LRPESLDDALSALATRSLTVVAGGTDIYPARVGRAFDEDVLDISRLAGLRGMREHDTHWSIGALTTWSDVLAADLPPMFDGLKLAAREVGGVQIQNAGTVAGNLCNASPAADGVPALMSLGAEVVLRGGAGEQVLPLGDFLLGNRHTARQPDQLMTEIRVPKPGSDETRGHFLKLGARRYLVISIVMAAAVIEVEDELVRAARVSVGACSEVAMRLRDLEAAMIGRHVDGELGLVATADHLAGLAPIDDVRAPASYRRRAALVLVQRLLNELGAGA
jgi:CO/xanthine dehydrogenase FAD-binding subunit